MIYLHIYTAGMNHGRAIWAWLTVLILLKIHKIAPTLLYTKEKQRKSHKISLQCSERLKPQIIVSFPLPQAMAGYLPSASRSPQPSSLSLLYQSDSSLCFTFLCSLVSRADSKSLLYFESETLDFTPSLQQTKHQTPNTKPHWFSSTHVSPLSRGAAEQRIGVLSLVRRTKGTIRRLSAFKLGAGSHRWFSSVLSLFISYLV